MFFCFCSALFCTVYQVLANICETIFFILQNFCQVKAIANDSRKKLFILSTTFKFFQFMSEPIICKLQPNLSRLSYAYYSHIPLTTLKAYKAKRLMNSVYFYRRLLKRFSIKSAKYVVAKKLLICRYLYLFLLARENNLEIRSEKCLLAYKLLLLLIFFFMNQLLSA